VREITRGTVVISLAPAEMRKVASSADLPIAPGILLASGQIVSDRLRDYAAVGELALDSGTRRAKGALSIAGGGVATCYSVTQYGKVPASCVVSESITDDSPKI